MQLNSPLLLIHTSSKILVILTFLKGWCVIFYEAFTAASQIYNQAIQQAQALLIQQQQQQQQQQQAASSLFATGLVKDG